MALLAVNYFRKNNSIAKVWQSPKCVSEISMLNVFKGKGANNMRSAIVRETRILTVSVIVSSLLDN